MIDSGSVSTFIDKSVARRLKLNILPKSKTVALADLNQTTKITGEVVIDSIQFNIIFSHKQIKQVTILHETEK